MKQLLHAETTFIVAETDLVGVSDADPEVHYTLRMITRDKLREITRHHTKAVPDPQSRRMVEQINGPAVDDDCLDYALVAWEGITLNGQPAPCTREHKLQLDLSQQRGILERCLTARRDEVARAESFRATPGVG